MQVPPPIESPRMQKEKKRLVHYFVVSGLPKDQPLQPYEQTEQLHTIRTARSVQRPSPLDMAYKAEILARYPEHERLDMDLPKHIWMFCFPKGVQMRTTPLPPLYFPFILTSENGDQFYGHTLTFYEKLDPEFVRQIYRGHSGGSDSLHLPSETLGMGMPGGMVGGSVLELGGGANRMRLGTFLEPPPRVVYAPKSISLISRHSFSTFFRDWLCELYSLSLSTSGRSIYNYVEQLLESISLPRPNEIIRLRFEDRLLELSQKPPDRLPTRGDIPLHYLFESLDVNNVCQLLWCVLTEQKVLLVSDQYTLLTYVGESIISLMYPFKWQQPYVPILPEFLMEILGSPTPFIMGVHSSYFQFEPNHPLTAEVVIVDLDHNSITIPDTIKRSTLPDPEYSELFGFLRRLLHTDLSSLDAFFINSRTNNNNNDNSTTLRCDLTALRSGSFDHVIRAAFLTFFVSMFRDYRTYFSYLRVFPEPMAVFNKKLFMSSRQHSQAWFETFLETQLFSNFLETHSRIFSNPFDDLIDKKIYDMRSLDIDSLKVDSPTQMVTNIPLPTTNDKVQYTYRIFPLIGNPIEAFLAVTPAKKKRTKKSPMKKPTVTKEAQPAQISLADASPERDSPMTLSPRKTEKQPNGSPQQQQDSDGSKGSEDDDLNGAEEQTKSRTSSMDLTSDSADDKLDTHPTAAGSGEEKGEETPKPAKSKKKKGGKSKISKKEKGGKVKRRKKKTNDGADKPSLTAKEGTATRHSGELTAGTTIATSKPSANTLSANGSAPVTLDPAFHSSGWLTQKIGALLAPVGVQAMSEMKRRGTVSSPGPAPVVAEAGNKEAAAELPNDEEIQKITEMLKEERFRAEFALTIKSEFEKQNSVDASAGCLKDKQFVILSELFQTLLREADDRGDLASPVTVMEAAFYYYRINVKMNGVQDYVHKPLRGHNYWQNMRFWEKTYYDYVKDKFDKIYQGDLRNKMKQWPCYDEAQKHHLITQEEDTIVDVLGTSLVYKMLNLGVAGENIRRLVAKLTNASALSEEKTKEIELLLASMTRAVELDEECMAHISNAQQGDGDKDLLYDGLGDGDEGMEYMTASPVASRGTLKSKLEGQNRLQSLIAAKSMPRGLLHRFSTNPLRSARTTTTPGKPPPPQSAEKKKRFKKGGKIAVQQSPEIQLDGTNDNLGYEDADYVVKTLVGHTEGVLCVKSSGNLVVSGSCDGTVKTWDAHSTECTSTLTGHKGWVNCVQIDVDKERLISGSHDRTLKLWDLHKGQKIRSLVGHNGAIMATKMVWPMLASTSVDESAKIWDLRQSKKPVHTLIHEGPVTCIDFHDGKGIYLTGSKDTTVKVWDMRMAGKCMQTLSGHKDWVKCLYLAEGEEIAYSGSCDGNIKKWNLNNGTCELTLRTGRGGTVTSFCFMNGSTSMLDEETAGGEKDKEKGKGKGKEKEKGEERNRKHYLLSATATGILKTWDADAGQCVHMTKGHADEVRCVIPFGTAALVGPHGQQQTSPHVGPPPSTSSNGGGAGGVGGTTIGGTPVSGSLSPPPVSLPTSPPKPATRASFASSKFVSCSLDGLLKMWRINHDGSLRCICTLDGHTHRVHCLDVHDSRVISGSWDKTVKIWEFPLEYLG